MTEFEKLIDELVAKAGLTTGYIKVNQDPVKVARLRELGYNEPVKEPTEDTIVAQIAAEEVSKVDIVSRLEALEATVADHEKRIQECSVRR